MRQLGREILYQYKDYEILEEEFVFIHHLYESIWVKNLRMELRIKNW